MSEQAAFLYKIPPEIFGGSYSWIPFADVLGGTSDTIVIDESCTDIYVKDGLQRAAVTATAPEKVPVKYNRDSQLSVDVTSDRMEYNFDLQSV